VTRVLTIVELFFDQSSLAKRSGSALRINHNASGQSVE